MFYSTSRGSPLWEGRQVARLPFPPLGGVDPCQKCGPLFLLGFLGVLARHFGKTRANRAKFPNNLIISMVGTYFGTVPNAVPNSFRIL